MSADSLTAPQPTAPQPTETKGIGRFFGNFELLIAILLGLVSIATAYASFQAALYDSQMAGAYTKGSNLSTEAESLYLEGNQQFMQDTQVWNRLSELQVEMNSTDAVIATDATEKYDTLTFMSVSEDFAAAIERSDALNEADAEFYYSPLDDEEYQASLFTSYAETSDKSVATIAEGDVFNSLSDRLTLNTVLMAISLFLLGVAAVVRQLKVQIVLVATSTVIFVVALALTVVIPYVGL
jgi:hypothetical protein